MSTIYKKVKNTYTNIEISVAKPTDEEVIIYDDSMMITETDTLGILTYANSRFVKLSGFRKDELIGSPQSIYYHPDMPVGLFYARIKIISTKRVWCSYVKNIRKDGKFYWCLMHMQAKLDEDGTIVGYTATRKRADAKKIREIEKTYSELSGNEHINHKYFMSATLTHGEHTATRAYVNSSET